MPGGQKGTVTVTNILVGNGNLTVDGTDVGAISGGLAVAKGTDVYDVYIDQLKTPVLTIPVKETFQIKTNMVEGTLANLSLIWNIPAANIVGNNTMYFGVSTGVREHVVQATGVGPNGKVRVYTVYRALSVQASEHAYMRDKETLFPVTFTCLADTTKPASQELGYIYEY